MQLNIKNQETHRLATELAELTGESLTSAVTSALREKIVRERKRRDPADVARRLMEIGRRFAETLDPNGPEPDEILGYDENGLPT